MSCNSCTKGFSLLRPEKGCPGCGFSFCSKCLNNKVFLPKLNSETKVCTKCKKKTEQKNNDSHKILPPDAYFKRLAATADKTTGNFNNTSSSNTEGKSIDEQIQDRLKQLKNSAAKMCSEKEMVSSTSDADINYRLAKLKGISITNDKPVASVIDFRTMEEQANDLIKQYVDQTELETKYKEGFVGGIKSIEERLQKLKGADTPSAPQAGMSKTTGIESNTPDQVLESEDEEESVRKIVEKIKAEATIEEDEIAPPTNDELPFCEICNEDATMRCLGCRYLFCKLCFKEHKDDDDGCNKYELYQPPKESQY